MQGALPAGQEEGVCEPAQPSLSPHSALPALRLGGIAVSAELLRRVVADYGRHVDGAPVPLSQLALDHIVSLALPGDPIETALAARLRILALACVVDGRFLEEWVQRCDPSGSVLFHETLFRAAATEPIIEIPPDGVGFDPLSLRSNVLRSAAARGFA